MSLLPTILEGAGFAALQSIFSQSAKRSISWYSTDPDTGAVQNQINGQPIAPNQLIPQVVVEERGIDELMITEHPVERTAAITDHAYKKPAELFMRAGWSAGGEFANPSTGFATLPLNFVTSFIPNLIIDAGYLGRLYTTLLTIQSAVSLVTLVTGKRTYQNMLLKMLQVTTDEQTETTLMIYASFKEIIMVSTSAVTLPSAAVQAQPTITSPIQNQGTGQLLPGNNFNPS